MSNFHNVLAWGDNEDELFRIQKKYLQYFPQHGTVLDLGCGRGIFMDLLEKSGFSPIGIELDLKMFQKAKEHGHKVFHDNALNFLKNTKLVFDAIFASHIIEHMPAHEGKELIELIKTRLRPNGIGIIITPRPGCLWATENFWLDTTHIRPFPYQLMKQLFYPFEIVAGGIEPDSIPLRNPGLMRKVVLRIRKELLGNELYDFVYGGGVSYIVARKPKGPK